MFFGSIVSWNVGPHRQFRDLARDLRQLIEPDDDIVALFEMTQRNTRLLRASFPGWRVLRPQVGSHGDRRADVVVMIRRRLRRPTVVVLSHNISWIGPKEGLVHRGRAHLQLTWAQDRLILVHRVPGGPKGGTNERTNGFNLRAWKADRRLIELGLSWPGKIAVIGDQNATTDEMRDEYEPLGLDVHITNTKVDHAATRGYPKARGRRLARLGSDHPAVRWTLQ